MVAAGLAAAGPWAGTSWGEILIALVIIAAVCAIAWIVVTRGMGIAVPQWFVQVLWVVIAAVIGILAIRFLLTL